MSVTKTYNSSSFSMKGLNLSPPYYKETMGYELNTRPIYGTIQSRAGDWSNKHIVCQV